MPRLRYYDLLLTVTVASCGVSGGCDVNFEVTHNRFIQEMKAKFLNQNGQSSGNCSIIHVPSLVLDCILLSHNREHGPLEEKKCPGSFIPE